MGFTFLQKFGAALLVTTWLVWGSNMIGNLVIPVREPPPPGDAPVAAASAPAAATAAAPAEIEDIKPLLAAAPVEAGEALFKRCVACHTADKGGPNRVGPNLWNVVGDAKASADGYAFSNALKDLGGEWTYDDLNHFIASPRGFAPGTKMTFAGIRRAEDRAALIAYMRTLADTPAPLP